MSELYRLNIGRVVAHQLEMETGIGYSEAIAHLNAYLEDKSSPWVERLVAHHDACIRLGRGQQLSSRIPSYKYTVGIRDLHSELLIFNQLNFWLP